MKSIFNFFVSQKKEYIGLSGFKINEPKKIEPKKEDRVAAIEKTSLTGLLKRV